jgi:hypothetical protein
MWTRAAAVAGLLCVVAGASGASAAGTCDALKAKYRAGYNNLIYQVGLKSPVLLMQYSSALDEVKSSKVPSRSEAMRALAKVEPSCRERLGEDCAPTLAKARSFILAANKLTAQYERSGCEGTVAD